MRTADGDAEVQLRDAIEHFADRDPLRRVVLERMLAGVSTRRYRRTQEPVGERGRGEGAVDVEVGGVADVRGAHPRGARQADGAVSSRDLRLAVMMLDGLELKGRMMIVALGITTEGVKIPLGLWEGSTENATSRPRCCQIWSSGAWIPSRGCCS